MHRSSLSVLVIFAAAAACSTHDDSDATQLLSKDPALAARLEVAQDDRQLSLPDACGSVATGKVAVQPSATSRSKAEELTRQADKSEILGDVQDARTLLRRASELDATNTSAAYHLGRTSEELGDSTAAMKAYCRYLVLSPSTPESVEARERVTTLSRSVTSVATGNVSDSVSGGGVGSASSFRRIPSTPLLGATHAPRTHHSRASTAKARAVATTSARRAHSVSVPEGSTGGSSRGMSGPGTGATSVSVGEGATERSTATVPGTTPGSDVVAAGRDAPSDDQSSTASRPASRGPNRAQSAGIGAATGAILGAVTGRSMKSAVIGAAAGGILGTMVGRGGRPLGSGTFH